MMANLELGFFLSNSNPCPYHHHNFFSKPQKFIGACHLSEDKLILNVHSLQPNICWIILPFQWNQTLTKTISLFCLAFSIYSHVCRESDGAGKGWKLLDGWANNAKWDGKRMHLPLSKCTVVQFDNQMLEILVCIFSGQKCMVYNAYPFLLKQYF